MNEMNYTVMSTDTHKNGTLVIYTSFLHNIQVVVSNNNEAKVMEK